MFLISVAFYEGVMVCNASSNQTVFGRSDVNLHCEHISGGTLQSAISLSRSCASELL